MKEIGIIAALLMELIKLGRQLFEKSEKQKRAEKLTDAHKAIEKARKDRDLSDLERLLNL